MAFRIYDSTEKAFSTRSCYKIGKLPKDARIEMEVIALQ